MKCESESAMNFVQDPTFNFDSENLPTPWSEHPKEYLGSFKSYLSIPLV